MKIWTEGPLKSVPPDWFDRDEERPGRTLHMARNSCESFQILLKGETDFFIEGVRFTPAEDGLSFDYRFQETVAFAKEEFVDSLSNDSCAEGKAGEIKSIWVTVRAGKGLLPGVYRHRAAVTVSGQPYPVEMEIRVYPAALPSGRDAAFSAEYWINTVNFWFRYPDPGQRDFIRHFYGHEKYSPSWWELNEKIAWHMKESRINVLFVRTHDLLLDGGTSLDGEGTYCFRWELFDRFLDLFDARAEIRYFAGYHLVVQTEGKRVYLIRNEGGKPCLDTAPVESPEAENWLRQFLPALYAHLQKRGDAGRWLQHIQDEPGDAESWKEVRERVKTCMPGIPCLDAIDRQEPAGELQGGMDLWIPRVDVYENNREFYDFRLARGDRRWTYTCCEPNCQKYANRFLGWPLLHSRVLPWCCFVNHFDGFLHWGYNFWDPQDPWFGLNPDAFFKGDGYIVYPDREHNDIKNSIRMIAARDGVQDYELLVQLAVRDPKKAFDCAKKVAKRFDDFDWSTENLERVRVEVLEALSGCGKEELEHGALPGRN